MYNLPMSPVSEQTTTQIQTGWIILATFNLGVAIFSLWNYHSGSATREVALISAAIVLVAGNLGVLFLFRKQRNKAGTPSPRSFIPTTIIFAIISFAIVTFGVSHLHHHNDYLDIAMSDIPLSSIEPEQRRLVVELIRQRAAYSRENNKDLVDASAHPLNPALYSPESFANKAVMESTVAALTKFMNIDLRYYGQVQESAQNFRKKMAVCDPTYLKSWDKSMQAQEATQASAMKVERDWFASVTSLYAYAEGHTSDITLKQGRLVIAATPILNSFNQQMSHSKDLQQKQLDLVTLLFKEQQQAKQNIIQPEN
jgi:hypothetical protein